MGGIFYVYEHWRPDRDVCFYVGKGEGRRSGVMYGRNRYHTRVQEKLARLGMCVEVRLVADGLTEPEAFDLEIERIAFWRGQGIPLANLTAGGEGGSDPSEETRELMRQRKLGRKLTDEHRQKIGEASKRSQADPAVKAKQREAMAKAFATPEYKAKQSRSQREKPRTKEHYEKVAAALRGRKLSPEHREKARRASLGRKQPQEEIERRRISLRAAWVRRRAKMAAEKGTEEETLYLWPWDEEN